MMNNDKKGLPSNSGHDDVIKWNHFLNQNLVNVTDKKHVNIKDMLELQRLFC